MFSFRPRTPSLQVKINGRPMAIIAEALAGSNIDNCPHVCVTRPCGSLAACVPTLENYECVCNPANALCNQAEEVPSIQINVAQQRHQLELKRNITQKLQRQLATSAAAAAPSTTSPSTTLPTDDADLLRTHVIKTASEIIVASSSDSVTIIDHLRAGRREDVEELARHRQTGNGAERLNGDQQQAATATMQSQHDVNVDVDDVDDDDDGGDYQADQPDTNDDYDDDYYYADDKHEDEDYNSEDTNPTGVTSTKPTRKPTTPTTTTARTTTTSTTTTSTTTAAPSTTTESVVVEHPQYTRKRIRGRYLSVDNDRLIQMDQNLRLRPPYMPYAAVAHTKKDYGRKSKKAQHISAASGKTKSRAAGLVSLVPQQEDLQTTKELLDDMERIMKNGNDYRAREAAAAASGTSLGARRRGVKGVLRRSRGACFTGADSYFHYNDAETMRQIISYQIDLNLRFKTHSVNGLLLWTGRHSALEVDDYLSLGIENGCVEEAESLWCFRREYITYNIRIFLFAIGFCICGTILAPVR